MIFDSTYSSYLLSFLTLSPAVNTVDSHSNFKDSINFSYIKI